MREGQHLSGGAPLLKKFKIGASIASAGIPVIDGTAGVIPCTTTDAADTPGLALDTAVYTTSQAAVLAAGGEALVTVSVRPDLVIISRVSGSSTEGVAMSLLTNTSASAGGTTVSDATNTGTASMATGYLYGLTGNNRGESRIITTFNSAASNVVTVPFRYAIAVGDTFLFTPFSAEPAAGTGNAQTTTLFTEIDGSIVAGTGLVVTVVEVQWGDRLTTQVLFLLADHLYAATTI